MRDFHLKYPGISGDALTAAFETLQKCVVNHGECGFEYPFIAPGGYGNNWWQIDTSMAIEGYKWLDFSFAADCIRNFIKVQRPDGRIPLYGPDTLPVSPNHPRQIEGASSLPKLFGSAARIARMSGDRAFVRDVYGMLKRYLNWWTESRLDAETGLISSLFEETFPPYLGCAGEYCGVDTGVEVALGVECCAELAVWLGEAEDARRLRGLSERVFAAMQTHLWSEEAQLYLPYELNGGRQGELRSAGAFGMLADRRIPLERKRALLQELQSDHFLWNQHPIASVSREAPSFTITRGECYQYNASWSGMTWALVNRDVVRALRRSGEEALAAALADRTLRMLAGDYREFYDPFDGTPHGARDYAWTAACFITLLLEDIFGISYDGAAKEVRAVPMLPRRLADERLEADFVLPGGERCLAVIQGGKAALTLG